MSITGYERMSSFVAIHGRRRHGELEVICLPRSKGDAKQT